MASTVGDSGDVEMSPRTTRTVQVAWPNGLRATTARESKIHCMQLIFSKREC